MLIFGWIFSYDEFIKRFLVSPEDVSNFEEHHASQGPLIDNFLANLEEEFGFKVSVVRSDPDDELEDSTVCINLLDHLSYNSDQTTVTCNIEDFQPATVFLTKFVHKYNMDPPKCHGVVRCH